MVSPSFVRPGSTANDGSWLAGRLTVQTAVLPPQDRVVNHFEAMQVVCTMYYLWPGRVRRSGTVCRQQHVSRLVSWHNPP